MKSQTTIATHEATRLCKRLINHWRHKFDIDSSDIAHTIHMAKDDQAIADITLTPSEDSLHILIDLKNPEYQDKVKQTTINHLEHMGEGGLVVQWQVVE